MHLDSKAHGGIALIISSIKHFEIDKHQNDFLQTTIVKAEAWNKCSTISAVYLPPKYIIKSE